jgi:methionyl-tRNA formyltransferase
MTEYYIVASSKPWHRSRLELAQATLSGHWSYVADRHELGRALEVDRRRYIFFLHWNWMVPREVWSRHECVCFHMTDVPYGRGGSPLQNLIARGHEDTMMTALRMVDEMDAGPVYAKRPFSLHGRAEEIYLRAGDICWDVIDWMIRNAPHPTPQQGEVTHFSRRKPSESRLPEEGDLRHIYNHIRMLDAPTYPLAYIEHGDYVLEFSRADLSASKVTACVRIRRKTGEGAKN